MSERNLNEKSEVLAPLAEAEKLAQATEYWREKLTGEERITPPQHGECRCTIVVPVYGESIRRIEKQLVSIRAQTVPAAHYEVIYVVNNRPNATDTRTKAAVALNQSLLKYLEGVTDVPVYAIDKSSVGQEIEDCNVGKARNRGVAEATRRFYENGKNGIIIQTDADTYFENTDYLAAVIAAFETSPDVVGVAGGLVFEFSPDTFNDEERELVRSKIDRLLYLKIWQAFQAFLRGEFDAAPKQTNFSGAHMLSRSYETAVIGGLNDEDFGEDQQFGFDLTEYARHNLGRVVGMKDELQVITALRDSDRTPASFKKTLDAIDMTKPLLIEGEVIDAEKIEATEKIVLLRAGGQELLEYMRKTLDSVRMGE